MVTKKHELMLDGRGVVVKNLTPSFAKSSKSVARVEMKLNMSYLALVRRTKREMINCTSIPTMTGCQSTRFRSLEVKYKIVMSTTNPTRLTTRFARVLSADSGGANAPITITAITNSALTGVLHLSGIARTIRVAVLSQTQRIGAVSTVTGTYKDMIRSVMARHNRKGINQPRS